MKKTFFLTIVILCCVQLMNAQTPCDKTFSRAKELYRTKDYANAKTQFQKVVDNCDSNKEIAQEYIKLCNGWIGLDDEKRIVKEQNKSMSDADARRIKELETENQRLQNKNLEYAGTFDKSAAIIKRNDSIMNDLSDTIRMKQEVIAALYSSLRVKGEELNEYLNVKLSKTNKKKIQSYDKVRDDSLMVVFGKNLKLVKEIK